MRRVAILVLVLLIVAANDVGEHCRIRDNALIICRCNGQEEFFLPEGYNYENVTSLRLESCDSANLHFSSLTEANRIDEIIVQNITDILSFELFLTSKRVRTLKLSKIRRVPLITHDTFTSLSSIGTVWIEDTVIEKFEEQFTDIAVTNFILINVTIERINGVNFSERGGGTLRIVNSVLRNVTGPLNFAYFSKVEIVDSKFSLRKPGHLLIEGDVVSVGNSVFTNASMNVVATSSVTMNGTCADGKSSLRLSSPKIESFDNRLPTEIVYTKWKDQADAEDLLNRNNTVCVAGNCKCPKRNGQSSAFFALASEAMLLPFLLAFSS